jgi:colicin import membrane protein
VAEAKRKEEDRKRKQQEEEAREARETQRVARQRQENLNRMQGLAGGTGAPSSTGTAARSSGPSASWGGRVQSRVRPNIVFTDDVSGNPKAEVEVRLAPDGTIIGKRLVRSSGVKSWDDAVLRALDKTEVLPRDVDGTVPSSVTIDFRPRG